MAQKPDWMTRDDFGRTPQAGAQLRKGFTVDKLESMDEPRRLRFIISDGSVDRDNDTIDPNGWDLTNFMANPVVLWAHSHSMLPVGRAVRVGVEAGKLVAVAEFATHPFAETVLQMLKGGFLRATSVGFSAQEYVINEERRGIDFKRQELLEFSIVPVPANANALIAASAAGVDLEPVRQWLQETIEAWPGELRLKGKAWEKLQPRLGLDTKINVDSDEAMAKIAALREQLDAVTEKADRVSGLLGKIDCWSPASGKFFMAVHKAAQPETLRWNKSLSESFDITTQEFSPQSVEQAMVARYCACAVKDLHHSHQRVASVRMGAFLSAVDSMLGDATVDDVRNLDAYGKEAPPLYETIQLNSTRSGEFLVDGLRFLRWHDAKLAVRVEPRWYGLEATFYTVRERADVVRTFAAQVQERASQFKFLKGEAFSLSGEFIARGGESFDDLFLSPKNADALKRVAKLVNDNGAALDNRGVLLVGPPGTGKTLGGRVLMNQAKATFIWLAARDFYYGGGFRALDDAFELAKENAPTILFIEDVDAYLTNDVTDLLKTAMDGLATSRGVVTVLTSNYPEHLPKAIIDRPGRFHDVLRFDLPDDAARKQMLAKWLPDLQSDALTQVLQALAGYSGAHVREFARFVGIIREQDGLSVDDAATAALAKIQEQRDLITAVQTQGSRYRAPSHVTEKSSALTVGTIDDILALRDEVSRDLAGEAEIAKRGRVLSAANERRLRKAGGCASDCQSAIAEVLDTLAEQNTESGESEFVLELADMQVPIQARQADAEAYVLELADEPDGIEIDQAALRDGLREAVSAAMGQLVQESVERTLNRIRGRVD
jgi:HK97 family phage prohead protease